MNLSKRNLFLIASLVWFLAGSKVLDTGLNELLEGQAKLWPHFILAFIGYTIFYPLVFLNVLDRNFKRVITSKADRLPAWAFFDRKGYLTMAFMIGLGISLRKLAFIPKVYLGVFYILVTLSLYSGSLSFFYAWLRYSQMERKYK